MFKIKFFLLFSLFIFFSSLDILAPHNSEALCIKNERANLRKGPGIQYEKLWEVFKYMPFKKLGFKQVGLKKDWIYFNGEYKNEYLFQLICT